MIKNNYGEFVYNEDDVCDILMRGRDITTLKNMLVDSTVNVESALHLLDHIPFIHNAEENARTVQEWDHDNQQNWHMPQQYKDLDIAEYILSLCSNEAELQRVGEELLLYQERDLFNLLRYLKYLVDVMRENHVIWGVGRGSSVSSYILYKLGVHKIDSMFYKLDIKEFLR